MEFPVQDVLPGFDAIPRVSSRASIANSSNAIEKSDRRIHDWYRFVLSFPPHLVRRYFSEFGLDPSCVVLDPFCGTGTTLVEAKLSGLASIGVEAHPFTHFASSVKVDWDVDVDSLVSDAETIADEALSILSDRGVDDSLPFDGDVATLGLPDLEENRRKLLIKHSISPVPLAKSLLLISRIERRRDRPHYGHMRLALAKALVSSISNLRFGPEVGVGKIKSDTPVVAPWLDEVRIVARDLRAVSTARHPHSMVHLNDSRSVDRFLSPGVVDAVVTSPPYPNEKDYTRTTRLETVLLGFITTRSDLRTWKKGLVRSNTRGVYKADADDQWVAAFPEILQLAEAVEERRRQLGKTSGFERQYHRVIKLYFGGMARHLRSLQPSLKPGARLAYVLGDQASYLRVMIRTGSIVARIAEHLGYRVERIDLFRKRFATATREELREEVVILRWPGSGG